MGPRITDAADRWLTGRLTRSEIKHSTADRYRRAVDELVEAVGDKRVHRLSPKDVDAWMAHTAHHNPSTRKLRHGVLVQFGQWCVDEGLMGRNPFRQARVPRPPRRPPRGLTHDAVGAVLAHVKDNSRDRLIVLLMVQQGLRCVGVANLNVEDVDLDAGTMRVREKFDNERVLPITDECRAAVVEYLAEHPASSGPLIRKWMPNQPVLRASGRGLSASTISQWVSRWMAEAGVKVGPRDGRTAHALRHTCATDLLAAGADLMVVRDVLGHTSLATTQAYLSVQPSRLADAMAGRTYA